MKRLHTRIVVWGSFLGMRPTQPTELLLRGLPPPTSSLSGESWEFCAVGAGSKHIALLTTEGHFVLLGNNKHGQAGQPPQLNVPSSLSHGRAALELSSEWQPFFYDLEFPRGEAPDALSCGSNSTLFYRRGTRRVVAIGSNSYGQLGVGHKDILDNSRGFAEWDPDAPWWSDLDREAGRRVGIRQIASGYNHIIILMDNGAVYTCGTNLWGELGVGTSTSPMHPVRVTKFAEAGEVIVDAAAGCSWSLFLTAKGKLYGCGANNLGQLGEASITPVVVPFARPGTEKLMRARFVACGTENGVYVTRRNEVFFRGAIPELGVHHQSRYHGVPFSQRRDSASASSFATANEGRADDDADAAADSAAAPVAGPPLVHLAGSGATAFAVAEDGSIFGCGSNAEGQIFVAPPRKEERVSRVATAFGMDQRPEANAQCPSTSAVLLDSMWPVLCSPDIAGGNKPFGNGHDEDKPHANGTKNSGGERGAATRRFWQDRFAVGHTFAALLDPLEQYDLPKAIEAQALFAEQQMPTAAPQSGGRGSESPTRHFVPTTTPPVVCPPLPRARPSLLGNKSRLFASPTKGKSQR